MERIQQRGSFYPAGDLPCLYVPYTRVRRRQHSSKHTHSELCPLPNFTHSKEWGINSMMKPNTTSTALSADSLRNSPWQYTHTTECTHTHTLHTLTLLPDHMLCREKQIIILRDQRRQTNCFPASQKTNPRTEAGHSFGTTPLREATGFDLSQH